MNSSTSTPPSATPPSHHTPSNQPFVSTKAIADLPLRPAIHPDNMQWPPFEESEEWCLMGRQLRRFLEADRYHASKVVHDDFTWMDKWCPASHCRPNEPWFGEGWFRSDEIFYRDLDAWRAEMARYDEMETAQQLFQEMPHGYGIHASSYNQGHVQFDYTRPSSAPSDPPAVFMRPWPFQDDANHPASEDLYFPPRLRSVNSFPEPQPLSHHHRAPDSSFGVSPRETDLSLAEATTARSSATATPTRCRGKGKLLPSRDRSISPRARLPAPEASTAPGTRRWNDYRQREPLASSRIDNSDISPVHTSRDDDNALLNDNTVDHSLTMANDSSLVQNSHVYEDDDEAVHHSSTVQARVRHQLQQHLSQFRFRQHNNNDPGSQEATPAKGPNMARRDMDFNDSRGCILESQGHGSGDTGSQHQQLSHPNQLAPIVAPQPSWQPEEYQCYLDFGQSRRAPTNADFIQLQEQYQQQLQIQHPVWPHHILTTSGPGPNESQFDEIDHCQRSLMRHGYPLLAHSNLTRHLQPQLNPFHTGGPALQPPIGTGLPGSQEGIQIGPTSFLPSTPVEEFVSTPEAAPLQRTTSRDASRVHAGTSNDSPPGPDEKPAALASINSASVSLKSHSQKL
ncbi:hypothetical protein BKA56DRAFT_622854 [Ilyonectria sp. MPI-CAGE-AT-0026]|nr:hypothetical protein BKA56DRAFT_622854 [Ilyonectria sp. MPI-CAGE-AT-0026]